MKDFFVILGGMGTMATESFVRILNQKTIAHKDQDYYNYLVVNHATIPDRTAYILGESNDSPVEYLIEDINNYKKLNPDFFVLTCNTAHYFYDELIKVTNVPILHMPKIVVEKINNLNKKRIMILATDGTIKSKIYNNLINQYEKLEAIIPDHLLQSEVMSLIYDDIKENNYLNFEKYHHILEKAYNDYQCDAIILGCTELSFIQENAPKHNYPVFDAQYELVNRVIEIKEKM